MPAEQKTKVWVSESERYRYYASREWALRKNAVRSRCRSICEYCFSNPMIQTHHTTYQRFGHEYMIDLMGVCGQCHRFLSGAESSPGLITDRGIITSEIACLDMVRTTLILSQPIRSLYCLWIASCLWNIRTHKGLDFRSAIKTETRGCDLEEISMDANSRMIAWDGEDEIKIGRPVFTSEYPWLQKYLEERVSQCSS